MAAIEFFETKPELAHFGKFAHFSSLIFQVLSKLKSFIKRLKFNLILKCFKLKLQTF